MTVCQKLLERCKMNFYPSNRHLLVQKTETESEQKTAPAVLLPDDYKPKTDIYGVYKLVLDAPDCSLDAELGDLLVVEQSMLKEVKYKGENYLLVQENYVLGVFSEEE